MLHFEVGSLVLIPSIRLGVEGYLAYLMHAVLERCAVLFDVVRMTRLKD